MINSINFSTNIRINYPSRKKSENLQQVKISKKMELSNYQIERTYFQPRLVSFKGVSKPKDVTSKYNVNEGKEGSIDLSNINVYEYPDTNLQVIVNKISGIDNKDEFKSSLSLINTGVNDKSLAKKRLYLYIINQSLKDNHIKANINEKYGLFLNIDFDSKTSDVGTITKLNNIITNPNITKEELEMCKNKLISYLNSEKYNKKASEVISWIDKSMIRSKEDVTKEIQGITLQDINNYHSDIMKNTEARYTITIDKDFVDKNNTQFYSTLNSKISNKFKKHSNLSLPSLKPIEHADDIKILDNNNKTYLSLHYPVNIETTKDKLIYRYLTLLEILWRPPYVSETSDVKRYALPMELQQNQLNPDTLNYIEFNYTPTGIEKIETTDEAIEIFKAIIQVLYGEELIENTLESLKKYEQEELYPERFKDGADKDMAHSMIHNYGYDMFNLYEIMNEITIDDIRDAMENIIYEQNPVVIINENLNPYTNKQIED